MVNTVYPPFITPPKHPLGEGMDVELAREALGRCGFDMRLELVPWRRVLMLLENGHADFTTTIARTDDRDRYLAWSPAYRRGANYLMYTKSDSPLQVASIADLQGLRLGLVEGFRYPEPLLAQPGVQRIAGRNIANLVAMMLADRTDAMVVTAIAGAWELRESGLSGKVRRQPYEYVSDSANYMGFSRSRLNGNTLADVSAALAKMAKDGTQAEIERRYRA
jgi:polar amino acid transport system substrate-binding protein